MIRAEDHGDEHGRELATSQAAAGKPARGNGHLVADRFVAGIAARVGGDAADEKRSTKAMWRSGDASARRFTLLELFVGPMEKLLLGLTALIVVVAGVGILVSIYNSMSERRKEIAVIRALGASREAVMLLIMLLESITVSLGGWPAGLAAGAQAAGCLGIWIAAGNGLSIVFWQAALPGVVIIPGLVVLAPWSVFPALVAYRTDVAKALVAAPLDQGARPAPLFPPYNVTFRSVTFRSVTFRATLRSLTFLKASTIEKVVICCWCAGSG